MHNPFDLSYKGISKHFSVSCTNQGLASGLNNVSCQDPGWKLKLNWNVGKKLVDPCFKNFCMKTASIDVQCICGTDHWPW